GMNDGAAAWVLMARSRAQRLGLIPRARIVASAVAGVDPAYMGLGPIPATQKVLQRTGLSIKDIDVIELNEAFAVQVLQCMRGLEIDEEKLNVNGGAIALGHPLGCSGARLVVTLLHELELRGGRYGLATMCIGVGQGIATIIERIKDYPCGKKGIIFCFICSLICSIGWLASSTSKPYSSDIMSNCFRRCIW